MSKDATINSPASHIRTSSLASESKPKSDQATALTLTTHSWLRAKTSKTIDFSEQKKNPHQDGKTTKPTH
jgi:hypothetical protein